MKLKKIALATICIILNISTAKADAVWHCSRSSNASVQSSAIDVQDQFSLASMGTSEDVIGISVRDLIDVYSGVPVRVGGRLLSACFLPIEHAETESALSSLGLQAAAIQALARKSAIIQSNLHMVTDEQQMLSCIDRHFPAVGYISKATETDKVMPCF